MNTQKFTLGALDGKSPPTEFRLFKSGRNDTLKGSFVFDATAASLVMGAARAHGVDYAIDLEHLSLDTESKNFDPDARGWFQLEVRNGELWAVNVRWTPDGARRLSEKTQRYISPAFRTDSLGRITEILNVALVAMPATHNATALIAASRGITMNPLSLPARLSLAQTRLAAADTALAMDVKAASEKAAEAISAVAKATGTNEVAAAVRAALEAMQEFEDALAIAGLAGDQEVDTHLGRVRLTENQLRECARAGARPEVFAERLIQRMRA